MKDFEKGEKLSLQKVGLEQSRNGLDSEHRVRDMQKY